MDEPSPCVGICILEDDICVGCGRSSAEIFQAGIDAGWSPERRARDEFVEGEVEG